MGRFRRPFDRAHDRARADDSSQFRRISANDTFADVLGLRTIWIPHSYAGCSQHAPDEHLLAPIAREGLGAMAGLFWDLGEPDIPPRMASTEP